MNSHTTVPAAAPTPAATRPCLVGRRGGPRGCGALLTRGWGWLRPAARARSCEAEEEGSALVWLMLLMPVLFALLGLIFDGGAAINGSQEADNIADQAARAGADQLDTTSARGDQGLYGPADAASAANTACAYVAVASPQMTCTASVNADAVVVAVSGTVSAQFFGIIGINELTVHGNGSANSHTGIDEEVQ